MEIIKQFKRDGYLGSDIYYILLEANEVFDNFLQFNRSTERISPSAYLKEMQINTLDRLKSIDNVQIENIKLKDSKTECKKTLKFSPTLLMFQNYTPTTKYEAKIILRNDGQNSTHVRMIFKESSYFFIKPGCINIYQIAPGMSCTFIVTFVPNEYIDYTHKINFVTDDATYVVPIIALGPRPLFNFPDLINVQSTPIKVETSTRITVKNIGIIPAAFTLCAKCPFSVSPKKVYVCPNDEVEIIVSFKTYELGEFSGVMLVTYETGENLYVKLVGTTSQAEVFLNKYLVRLLSSYVGMSRQTIVQLYNNSAHALKFSCVEYESLEADMQNKAKLVRYSNKLNEYESLKTRLLEEYEVIDKKGHGDINNKIFLDEIHNFLTANEFLFHNNQFEITPLQGELWPNTITNITVTFCPKDLGEFSVKAYFEIDGVKERLPLVLCGTSLPPDIKLKVETIELNEVYVNKTYNLEVAAYNKGLVPGAIIHKPLDSLFDSEISCMPPIHCIEPNEMEIFIITLRNRNQGKFFEEVHFNIKDTDILQKLYIKGQMVYPTLKFLPEVLEFGITSLGIPKTIEMKLVNNSPVPVNVVMKIQSDGPEINSVTLEDYSSHKEKPKIPDWPKEFNIVPNRLRVEPESDVSVQVTLTPNLIRANKTSLEIEIEKTDIPPLFVPILYDARIPTLILEPKEITMQSCFLNYTYQKTISITSEVVGGFYLFCDAEINSFIKYEIDKPQGFLEPNTTYELNVSIKISNLGKLRTVLRLLLFGCQNPIDVCTINVCGVIPIVTHSPSSLIWGETKLLQNVSKTLSIINDSPIEVSFTCSFVRTSSPWRVLPNLGRIKPNTTIKLSLEIYLIEAELFSNKLVVDIDNIYKLLIPLSARGIGTSITVGDLMDHIDLGLYFTKMPMNCTVIMKNHSSKHHILEWQNNVKMKKNKTSTSDTNTFFTLLPNDLKLSAGDTCKLKISAFTNKPEVISEVWYLVGNVEGKTKREVLLHCPITAEFLEPAVEIHPTELSFKNYFGPYEERYKLTDMFTIKNVSRLPVDLEISIQPPFYFIYQDDGYYYNPEKDREQCGQCICDNIPHGKMDIVMQTESKVSFQDFTDYVTHKPVDTLRKDKLDFFRNIVKLKELYSFTSLIRETLPDQDILRIQVIFDTTFTTTLHSKIFHDSVRIVFKNHKSKTSLKLKGVVSFPNILLHPNRLNFGGVMNGVPQCLSFKMTNPTPLSVCYKFSWDKVKIKPLYLNNLSELVPFSDSITESSSSKLSVLMPEEKSFIRQTSEAWENENEQTTVRSPTIEGDKEEELYLNGHEDHDFAKDSSVNKLILEEENKKKILEEKLSIKRKLVPMLNGWPRYDFRHEIFHEFKTNQQMNPTDDIKDLIDIVPHRGILKPNETITIDLMIHELHNKKIEGTVVCDILGGPSEYISLNVTSSGVKYYLNKREINLERRVYYRKAIDSLLLVNTGVSPLNCRTYKKQYGNIDKYDASICYIFPEQFILEPGKAIEYVVAVNPGIRGIFVDNFLLDIGLDKPITIDINGWGVLPQIYISLNRPEILQVPVEAEYLAIANITEEFLEAVRHTFMSCADYPYNQVKKNFLDTPLDCNLKENEWHICSHLDNYPSAMDTELALETYLINEYINKQKISWSLLLENKGKPIPGCKAVPYVIDYGVVIVGDKAQCEAQVVNYGPFEIKPCIKNGKKLPQWLHINYIPLIPAGGTATLNVIFAPTLTHFEKVEEAVETSFCIDVPFGASVPIIVKAISAIPCLVTKKEPIHFGGVKCGDKTVCSIPLKNVGSCVCSWFAKVNMKVKNSPNPFDLINHSNTYVPGQEGWMDIVFKPRIQGKFNAYIAIQFHMNPNKLIIPVYGEGQQPTLAVIGPSIDFEPTLPWGKSRDIFFGIMNPCSFPVELVFLHNGLSYIEEEKIYDLLKLYYKEKTELLIPRRELGQNWPQIIIDFYHTATNRIKSPLTDRSASKSIKSFQVLKRKTASGHSRKTKITSRTSSTAMSTASIKIKPEGELLTDELDLLRQRGRDPLEEVFEERHPKTPQDKMDTFGVILIFHGGPMTEIECMEMAYAVGKQLKLPVVNIDQAISEALVTMDCFSKETLCHLIDDLSREYEKTVTKDSTSTQETNEDDGDEVELMSNKLRILSAAKQATHPKSKSSDKGKRNLTSTPSTIKFDPNQIILPIDLLLTLLQGYFALPKFKNGFVIDSLCSDVVKSPTMLLSTVLKTKPQIKNVQMILGYMDVHKWMQICEEEENESEILEITQSLELEKILSLREEMDEMDASEYDALSIEPKSIYIREALKDRRERHKSKMSERHSGTRSKVKSKPSFDQKILKREESSVENVKKTTKKNDKATDKPGKLNIDTVMYGKFMQFQKGTFESLMEYALNWSFEKCELEPPLLNILGQPLTQKKNNFKKKDSYDVISLEKDKGFPLYIVLDPCLQYRDILTEILHQCPFIKDALTLPSKPDILKQPIKFFDYTILMSKNLSPLVPENCFTWKQLDLMPLRKCSCHNVSGIDLNGFKTQDEIKEVLSRWECNCWHTQFGGADGDQISDENILNKLKDKRDHNLDSLPSLSEPCTSLILKPNELVRCKYSFSPETEGVYTMTQYAEAKGWPQSRVNINVKGICDQPRLDCRPKKMFPRFSRRTIPDKIYRSTYLDDKKLFEFGPVYAGTERIYKEVTKFFIKNVSLIPTEVFFSFLDTSGEFGVETDSIDLQPGEKKYIHVYAAPSVKGIFKNTLLCCVKDNPEVIFIPLSCTGIEPDITILGKCLDFGRLLLFRRKSRKFIIKNLAPIPVTWKIQNVNDVTDNFIISETAGKLVTNEHALVNVTFIASGEGFVVNKTLHVDIFGEHGCDGKPLHTEPINIVAECYDILVDCSFENPNDTHLDFGSMKVNSENTLNMYLLNRGKYNIFYKIRRKKDKEYYDFIKTIEITEDTGIIQPTLKVVCIKFTCQPTTFVHMKYVAAFTCSLIDDAENQTVVARFPIHVSVDSYYNSYTILPQGGLSFQAIPLGTHDSKEIIITNTGKSPFTFEIHGPEGFKNIPTETSVTSSKKFGKNKDKQKISGLVIGQFTIQNDDCLLEPGARKSLKVQFFAEAEKNYEEIITFMVNDTHPSESSGTVFKLEGSGAVPKLSIWDLNITFQELMILKRIQDYNLEMASPHCVFTEDDIMIHFLCVPVKLSHETHLHIYNEGFVTSSVTVSLKQSSKSGSDTFTVAPSHLYVEPMEDKILTLTFKPPALEEYHALLEISEKNTDNIYKICIMGRGHIPRIRIIHPEFKDTKQCFVQFPCTYLGGSSTRPITFKNISEILTSVVIDIKQKSIKDDQQYFSLKINKESKQMLEMFKMDRSYPAALRLCLLPRKTANLAICYRPTTKAKHKCEVKILTINNPYESYTITCEGESFSEDILLLGIEMLPLDFDIDFKSQHTPIAADSRITQDKTASKDSKRKLNLTNKKEKKTSTIGSDKEDSLGLNISDATVLKYMLDLGGCELDTIYRRTMIMVNNSQLVYRFIWNLIGCIVMSPSAGFISPGEEKELVLTFLTKEPLKLDKVPLICSLYPITDTSPSIETKGNLWDDRQTVTLYRNTRQLNNKNRSDLVLPEPDISPANETPTLQIVIAFSVASDYTSFECVLDETIYFKDTLMYQSRYVDIAFTNRGVAGTHVKWRFFVDDQYPSRVHLDWQNSDYHENDKTITEENDKVEGEGQDSNTLFSDTSSRKNPNSWSEYEMPFDVTPSEAYVESGQTKKFRIIFAPMDAFLYIAIIDVEISHLHPQNPNLSAKVMGKSLVPYCHLDVEESDYITSGRRLCSLPAVSPDLRVIEFNVLGVGCYKKKFNVVNPTSENYVFKFECLTTSDIPISCNITEAHLNSGLVEEVCFIFIPDHIGVFETFWIFSLPNYGVKVDLMVVGIVREPEIFFKPTIVSLKETLVGHISKAVVKLENREKEELKFQYSGTSLYCDSIKVSPTCGILHPESETDIEITYIPTEEGIFNITLLWNITYMEKPLMLYINARSYKIKAMVSYSISSCIHTVYPEAITNLYMDCITPNYSRTIPFHIKNKGSILLFFNWEYETKVIEKYMSLSIEPSIGEVHPGEECNCVLTISSKGLPIIGYPICLHILEGPSYNIYIHAEIEDNNYSFSFLCYDFGKCFVNAWKSTYKTELVFSNHNQRSVELNMYFKAIPDLFIDCEQHITVKKGSSITIPIYFRPMNIVEYEFMIPFKVDTLHNAAVRILGQGVNVNIGLVDECQRILRFGSVNIGNKISKTINVINRGEIAVTASFLCGEVPIDVTDDISADNMNKCLSSSILSKAEGKQTTKKSEIMLSKSLQNIKEKKMKEQLTNDIKYTLESLKVNPKSVTIESGKVIPIKVRYQPTGIIKHLDAKLLVQVYDLIKPIAKIKGKACGMHFYLNQTYLQFGVVRINLAKTLRVVLMNKGDTGSRYAWESKGNELFTIAPREGFISPNTNVTINITFKSYYKNPSVKTTVECVIPNYPSLELTLHASCLGLEDVHSIEVRFRCPVRKFDMKNVKITNPSDSPWNIVPIIYGEAFETLDQFTVTPNEAIEVPIYFRPLTMGQYEGQILFSSMGDDSLYFTLLGLADDPEPTDIIQKDVFTRVVHTEELKVYNLTEARGTYEVQSIVEKIVPDKFEGYYEINAPKIVKVWGAESIICKWTFVCHKECTINIKVSFINKHNDEYQYYLLIFKVVKAEHTEYVEINTKAREKTYTSINIFNPLSVDTMFNVNFKHNDIECDPIINVPGRSKDSLRILHKPFIVGDSTALVEVSHPMCGSIFYELILHCSPANEKCYEVAATLGAEAKLKLPVHNYTEKNTEFIFKTDNDSYLSAKSYQVNANDKGSMLVIFEPMSIGTQIARVTFTSITAGEYAFKITGKCTEPSPLGPINMKVGGSSFIKFKNVFSDTKTFKIYVDQDDFSVKNMFETVKAKKEVKINVFLRNLKDVETGKEVIYPTGSLIIQCVDEPLISNVVWTYYLQGVP